MKSKIIIAGLVGAIVTSPSLAVVQCVSLNSDMTCSPDGIYTDSLDWAATCTANNARITVVGVTACSATQGTSVGQVSETLETDSAPSANKYCWCKMTSPVVSQWVYSGNGSSEADCITGCGQFCVSAMQSKSAFRAGIVSNLSN